MSTAGEGANDLVVHDHGAPGFIVEVDVSVDAQELIASCQPQSLSVMRRQAL